MLKFTDARPTKVGWYWRRDHETSKYGRILFVDEMMLNNSDSMVPWREKREQTIKSVENGPEAGGKLVGQLKALPDSHWLVEWAGPLIPPE